MKRKFVVTYLNLVVFHNIINIHTSSPKISSWNNNFEDKKNIFHKLLQHRLLFSYKM